MLTNVNMKGKKQNKTTNRSEQLAVKWNLWGFGVPMLWKDVIFFFLLGLLKYSSKNVKDFFDMIDLVSVPQGCLVVCETRDSSENEHVVV